MNERNNRLRHTSFKEVWKKAIEKYSPKKSMKLNEISYRFQLRVEEQQKQQEKNELETKGPQKKMNT